MLSFQEHIKRIIQLAEASLVHVQVDKFNAAQDDLFKLSHTARKAMKQISDMKSPEPNES